MPFLFLGFLGKLTYEGVLKPTVIERGCIRVIRG